jgi:hypothetical protein
MTIGIGYHCYNGVVVAADTAVIIGESELQEGSKLDVMWCPAGQFAFANTSHDANATKSLLDNIEHEFNRAQFSTYRDMTWLLKQCMTEWRLGFGKQKPPSTALVLGAKIPHKTAKLFFCEPPNTVREKDDHVAVGAGATVTDLAYETLFSHNGGEYADVHEVLRRVSYLIYRAKKDSAFCGKRTEALVIGRDREGPWEIDWNDLKVAEAAGQSLDFLLSSAAISAFGSDDGTIEANARELGNILESVTQLRSIKFHDNYGNEVVLPNLSRRK